MSTYKMKATVVFVLVLCSVIMQETRAQFPGIVGSKCREGNICVDKVNQVCDTHLSPPMCKIKAGKSCRNQPKECLLGATCQNGKCACDTEPLDNGQCQQNAVPTESPMQTTEQTTEDAATTAKTTVPVTSTTPSSGAVDHSSRCVGALIFPVVMMLLQHTFFSLPLY